MKQHHALPKKLISLLLILTMLFCMLQTSAFADEQVNNADTISALTDTTISTDDSWNTPAATTTTSSEITWDGSMATLETLLHTIAESYTTSSDEWQVMDMGAYMSTFPDGAKLTDSARQDYLNVAIHQLVTGKTSWGDMSASDYSKTVLATTAIGIDAEKLYPVNSNIPVNAISKLNNVEHSASAWVAPYILAAYNQNNYDNTKSCEDALIASVLANQQDNGAWNEYGDSIQTTANVIAGLAFYADQPEVTAAIDNAITYLSEAQKEDGTFDAYGSGADSNTAAMVVIGLCAVGVDPDTDSRFVKGDVSALDNLMAFALTDGSGFGYKNNTTFDAYATEQGFRALIAAYNTMQTSKAYNVYDFSRNELTPGRATGNDAGSSPATPSGDQITVQVSIKSNTDYWMKNKSVTIPGDGATVYHAFMEALNGSGITQTGAANGYVSAMAYNGRELSEFTNGPNSGWLYKVNGNLPDVGLTSYAIHDGDTILFYYTDDWTKDSSAGSAAKPEEEASEDEKTETDEAAEDAALPFIDIQEHWAKDAVKEAVARGLFAGVSHDHFAPDATLSRAMVVTVLYRLSGSQYTGHADFTDVPDHAWYANAVAWAAEYHIVNGYGDGSFGPNNAITREQLAAMLYQYASAAKINTSVRGDLAWFADGGNTSAWAENAMSWAVGSGLLKGDDKQNLRPTAGATRAEAAAVMLRFAVIVPDTPIKPDTNAVTKTETKTTVSSALASSANYLLTTTPNPAVSSMGGEWALIGLVRSGITLPDQYTQNYYAALEDYVAQCEGVLHSRKYTEHSRVVLALTAIEKDPTNVAGYDVLSPLADYDKVTAQGINGPIWALIAINSGNYDLGNVRQLYIDYILDNQHADGGWAISKNSQSDPDITAMALTALSNDRNQPQVAIAVEHGVACLSAMQNDDGTFSSYDIANAESCAQVVTALCTLNIPLSDSRFVKNGVNPLGALLTFQHKNGGFVHAHTDYDANTMASEQGFYALAAAALAEQGKQSLFDMR